MLIWGDTRAASAEIKERYTKEYGPVNKTNQGKPYFPQSPQMGLSIAHDGDLTVGVVAVGDIGIDIVRIPLQVEFSPQELEWLFSPLPNSREIPAFWAAREAYIKCTGHNPNKVLEMSHTFTCPEVPQVGIPMKIGPNGKECYLFKLNGYIGALCLDQSSPSAITHALEALT